MNGKAYLEAFEGTSAGVTAEEQSYDIGAMHSAHLTGKLAMLYYCQEILALGDNLEPGVVIAAEDSLAFIRECRVGGAEALALRRHSMGALGLKSVPDKINFSKRLKSALGSNLEVASEAIENEVDKLQSALTEYSDTALSKAVLGIQKTVGRKGLITEKQTAAVARDAITSQRARLLDIAEPWQGQITINRDVYDHKEVGYSIEVERQLKPTPGWMKSLETWEDPLHRLSAAIIELETLIVSNEWVVQRHLPYIPVISPRHIEKGHLHGNKNPHADILLCNISNNKNEIIPLQNKNHVSLQTIQKYISGMNFISPEDLGIRTVRPFPVKTPEGRTKTGHRVTTEIGKILQAYLGVYGRKRGHRPSKKEQQAYQAVISPGMDRLDSILAESQS